MKKVNITHLNNEHNYWLRALNFYKTEFGIMKGILTEIAGKNTASEVSKEVEHFENQFKIQADNIDRLAHDIHVNINHIGEELQKSGAGFFEGKLVTAHDVLGKKYEEEEKIATELIQSFRKFAGEWM